MALFGSRRTQVVRRRADGRFDLVLEPHLREVISSLLGELDELVEAGPGDPSLERLAPPAYLDDADKDAEYQLLAGDELRTSRRAAIEATQELLGKEEASEAELWSWLQSLNALRLVVGTRLGIDEDEPDRPQEPEGPDAGLWSVYDFATWLQWSVIQALGG